MASAAEAASEKAKPVKAKKNRTSSAASPKPPGKHIAAKPDTGKPDTGKPDAGKPGVGKPDAGKKAAPEKAAPVKAAPEKKAAATQKAAAAKNPSKAPAPTKQKAAQTSQSTAAPAPAAAPLRLRKIMVRTAPPPPAPPPVDRQAEQAAKVVRQLELRQAEYYDKAVTLFNTKKFARALSLLEKTLEGPDATLRHRAQVYTEICRRQISNQKVQLKTAEDHYNYAVKLMNDRRLEEAQRYLQRALQIAPKAGYVHYANAVLSALLGDADSAFGNLKRAIEIDPLNRVLALNDADLASVASHPRIAHLLNEVGES
jgi:tetratricopeptide (TPR) repeat protein